MLSSKIWTVFFSIFTNFESLRLDGSAKLKLPDETNSGGSRVDVNFHASHSRYITSFSAQVYGLRAEPVMTGGDGD